MCHFTIVEPEENDYLEQCKTIKQTISKQYNLLNQNTHAFERWYQKYKCYVLHENDNVIGFAILRDKSYIVILAVDPDHQNNGYGSTIINRIQNDHRQLSCHVRTTNPAVDFYERHGFNIEDTIERYYRDNDNAYYMSTRENQ